MPTRCLKWWHFHTYIFAGQTGHDSWLLLVALSSIAGVSKQLSWYHLFFIPLFGGGRNQRHNRCWFPWFCFGDSLQPLHVTSAPPRWQKCPLLSLPLKRFVGLYWTFCMYSISSPDGWLNKMYFRKKHRHTYTHRFSGRIAGSTRSTWSDCGRQF